MADYVFPASSTVERPELWLSNSFCMACPQGVGPLYERRNSYDFYRGLGLRLGQAEQWLWETVEEVYDHCLEPVDLTFKELANQHGFFGDREYQRYKQYGFGTPSGKVELHSSIFQDLGLEPLPLYREPLWSQKGSPDLSKEYPLIMITGSRFMPMYHSEHRQLEKTRKKMPDPLVSINPKTAEELGVTLGDWARISLRRAIFVCGCTSLRLSILRWWMYSMAGGSRSVKQNCRNSLESLNLTPTFFAWMDRNFVARKSAVGRIQLCFAVWKKNDNCSKVEVASILFLT